MAVLCSKADSPALFGPDGMTKVVVAPATVTRSPVFQEMPRHCVPVVGGPSVRFYAGQPDPKDAAHFTIRCVVTQGKGRAIEHVIDGWLRDDNTVKLVARDPLSEWGEWQGPSGR